MQGSRAYWVARSGLEWGIASVLASAPVAPAVTPLPSCPGTAPTPVEGFTLVVTCTPQTFDEAGVSRTLFRLQAVATSGGAVGGVSYIERSVSASLEL
jgi:MSHA biogenesis protein MshP